MSLGIVLVEDEGIQAVALQNILHGLGHRVLGLARDGLQACRLCRELRPDMVLMDIGLPVMDGIEAARVINQERPLPVVLITAHADRQFLERASRASVHSYLLKPVEAAVLGPAMELAYQNFNKERDLTRQVTDLRDSLRLHKIVERATGLIMDRRQLTHEQARARLERMAKEQGQSLEDAAQDLLAANDLLKPPRTR